MTRRIVIAVGVALIVAALLYYLRTRGKPTESNPPPTAAVTATSSPSSTAQASKPPQHATKLASAEERQHVADRIANAQAVRHARVTEKPSLQPADTHDEPIYGVPTHVQDALAEAIPFLADCYVKSKTPTKKPAVMMTLTGDPDVGTLIDTDQMLDQDGKPLARDLDECLRATLSSLELPPLAEGNKIKVQYSFNLGVDE